MQSLVCPPSAAPSQASEYTSAVFPQSLVLPLPAIGWVYTFPGPFRLARQQMQDSFLMDHLDVPRVDFILEGMRMDLTFSFFSKSVIAPTLDFNPSRILLWVRSIPSTGGRTVSGSSLKGFTFGLGLVP